VERTARAAGRPARLVEQLGYTVGVHRDTVRLAPAGRATPSGRRRRIRRSARSPGGEG
jgi:hypothetical protein